MVLKKTNVVNEVEATQKTPLFYAIHNATEDQINVLRILLENGANINHQDLQGKTALHYAAELGKTRCLPFLLQKGSNVDARDKHNKTPMDLASSERVTRLFQAYR